MRLHRVRLTAFGPFAGAQEIDFDALTAHGLFLLHGETGAGKTTILDAIGFALYGQLPGARQTAKRLRSDHAEPGVLTEVILEATVRGRRVEVTRRPEQARPRKRGDGDTVDPSRVWLRERVEGQWQVLSTRVGEVDDLLRELLGMTAAQFFQVVMLPQGEFARFLRADAEERRALLVHLFHTGRFADVEEWLRESRLDAARAVGEAEEAAALVAARAAQVAGAATPELADRDWLAGLQADCAARCSDANVAAKEATAALDRARAEHARAVDLQRRQSRRRAAEQRWAALLAGQQAYDEAGRRLDAARRATAVMPVVSAAEAAAAAADAAAAAERRRRADLAGQASALAGLDPAGLTGRARAVRDEVARLAELVPLAAEVARDRSALAALTEQLRAAGSAVAAGQTLLASWPLRREEVERALHPARAVRDALPGRETKLIGERARLRAAEALRRQDRDVEAASVALAQASEHRDAARGHWLDVREQRLAGMAAELAAGLRAGEPCPVCGATEHPGSTAVAAAGASADDEAAALADFEAAAADSDDATAVLADARAEQARLVGEIGGDDVDPDDVQAGVDRLTAEVERERQLAATVPDLENRLAWLDEERAASADRLAAAQVVHADLGARRAALSEGLAERVRRLDAARGDDPSVGERLVRLGVLADSCEAAAAAAGEAARQASAAAAAAEGAAQAVAAAGFGEVTQARAAAVDEAVVVELERRRRKVEAEESAVRALLAEPDLAVPVAPPADVGAAAIALEIAEVTAAEAAEVRAHARQAVRALDELGRALADALEVLGPLRDRHAEIAALADLTAGSGANVRRMRLSAFVLAARLEEVAAAASVRLERMSGRRYTLVHSDALAAGGRRSGLGLLVQDSWCGVARDPGTLSGGETFLASLALALGLADVVTAEAGGAPVETLFVDEGFGSLDDQTLDEVMDVLDGLRDGGRVVGLVSHVAELRQRVTAQLRVRKGRRGSAIEMRGA